MEEAKQVAHRGDKDLLVYFSGLPWCPPCVTLVAGVFEKPSFESKLEQDFVLVNLNLAGDQSESDAYTQKWSRTYSVGPLPTVFLMDSSGDSYALANGIAGPEAAGGYVDSLFRLRDLKKSRDGILSEIEQASGLGRARLLDRLFDLDPEGLLQFGDRVALMGEILELAGDREPALRDKYAAPRAELHVGQVAFQLTADLLQTAQYDSEDQRAEVARRAMAETEKLEQLYDPEKNLDDTEASLGQWYNLKFMVALAMGDGPEGLRRLEEAAREKKRSLAFRQGLMSGFVAGSQLLVHGSAGLDRAMAIYDAAIELAPDSAMGKRLAANREMSRNGLKGWSAVDQIAANTTSKAKASSG